MKVLVTSPMRTGSTWVHEMLTTLLKSDRNDFVFTVGEALAATEKRGSCVLKSHSIIDLDLPGLSGHLHTIRVLRNYKDSLISRALYCRNVRPAEGLPNRGEEDAIIERCMEMRPEDFVNEFLANCPFVQDWIEEIAVFERGEFDHTFFYEMLLHNARDQFLAWMEKHLNPSDLDVASLDLALERHSFRRMMARNTPGFIGSTGVGQWMFVLREDLIRQLDAQYLALRAAAMEHPETRRPSTFVATQSAPR